VALIRRLLFLALLASVPSGVARAQGLDDEVRVSLVYTGRSLGALGVLRGQEEHELLTEQANAEGLFFRLVSHPCWRAPGISIFLPTEEPEGDELPALLAARATAERTDSWPALRSNNGLLVQDPWAGLQKDLLAMLRSNARAATSFPDLVETRVTVSRLKAPNDEWAVVVEEDGAAWPDNPDAWSTCEMNRVDVLLSRLYELPSNLGEIGPRATVLKTVVDDASSGSAATLVADLGERDGDVGVGRAERARIDYTALRRMGYSLAVPFEFELALGASALGQLRDEFPEISFLAANVQATEGELFEVHRIVEVAGVRLGLFGIVDPDVQGQLPRATLADFTFESPLDAAVREVRTLREAGVDAIVALSNLHPSDNAMLANGVGGIDVIVADLHERWSPEALRTEVELPDRPRSRPGSPALVARGFANGLGVGRVDLVFQNHPDNGGRFLASVSHALESVTDRTPADNALVAEIQTMANIVKRPRGELMFPAFVDLTTRHPELRSYDETTMLGRVSQRMWEEFMARMLRNNGRAEVAVIRTLPNFPPLIGKLHEQEVRGWLWTEDEIVLLDLQGADLRKVLLEDTRGELVVSGIDRNRWTIGGRRIDDRAYYRVATTDVLFEGARFRDFERGRRVRRTFQITPDGFIQSARSGTPLPLRDFMLGELQRLRAVSRSNNSHIDLIAQRIAPDPPYEDLLVFAFDRPTLWFSLNQVFGNDGYGTVPESRVISNDSWVVGLNGRFKLTYDRRTFASDFGLSVAYARQSARLGRGGRPVTESADDLKLDLTLRPKTLGRTTWRVHPFVRAVFDTEFTSTTDPVTGLDNPHQLALRGVGGVMFAQTRHWRDVELGVAIENDFGQSNVQFGFQGRAEFMQSIGPRGVVVYHLRNDATYFLPSGRDTESDLALRYNMVHEVVIPLVDELSLSMAADFFFFKGKVDATQTPGASMLLRVGLTYDRLWKPRYQPLF
jgi:2',3'-cyclic-nucleotide 2'-phosphodiesterase (5'-nucleotidase family)